MNKEYEQIATMLDRLAIGDPDIRIDPGEGGELIRRIAPRLNAVAEYLQRVVNESHETAIGLCEHYETLQQLTGGNLDATAQEESPNELIAKLGELINSQAETFRTVIELQHQQEDELRSLNDNLHQIIEFLPDATFVIDSAHRVTAWNRAIENLTGVKKQDIIGKGEYAYAVPFYNNKRPVLIDLLDHEEERLRHNYRQISIQGQTLFTEVHVPAFRQGGSRFFWATATPLFDREGNRVGAIESIRDITDYKRAEKERAELQTRLDHAQMIENFMDRLGHDLRTPLTPLCVLLPLIKGKLTDPHLIKMLELCIDSSSLIKKMMDRAQKLVRLSARIDSQPREYTSLHSALESALSESVAMMTEKNIVCSASVPPEITIMGVPEQLKELFSNLISNAVHVSPENSIITVTALQEKETISAAVHDAGIGLLPEHLERIFEELFKVDESRHDLDAPGLGLAICRRIVANHHGRIWAESPGIGLGTTIRFTLNEQHSEQTETKEPAE